MLNLVTSELTFALVPKQVFVRSYSTENEIDLHVNELTVETHVHGFATRLVLVQRQKATRKCPNDYLNHT